MKDRIALGLCVLTILIFITMTILKVTNTYDVDNMALGLLGGGGVLFGLMFKYWHKNVIILS